MSATHFKNKIKAATTADECREVKNELASLVAEATSKLNTFEAQEKAAGLKFKGKNSFECCCGNSAEAESRFIGTCEDCEDAFCVDCLAECDNCGKCICSGDSEYPCGNLCEGCEDMIICSECTCKCDYCKEEKCCSSCLKEVGPYGQMFCPNCFEYINTCNM